MRDPALWSSWYVVLLLFPFMIIILLLRDFLAGRGRRTEGTAALLVSVDFALKHHTLAKCAVNSCGLP